MRGTKPKKNHAVEKRSHDTDQTALRATVVACEDRSEKSDGVVLRIFTAGVNLEYGPIRVANIVRAALHEVKAKGRTVLTVALPAGIGGLGVVRGTWRTKVLPRSVVEARAKAWAQAFQMHLGSLDADVVLGLDGAAEREGWEDAPYSIQTAVLLHGDALHLTFKSLPSSQEERTWLMRPCKNVGELLRESRPFARGGKALLLVCHDGLLCSGRGRRNSSAGSWVSKVRARLLPPVQKRQVEVAYNLIHKLPKSARALKATSPSFQDSHNVMGAHGVQVIAVAGVPGEGETQMTYFRQLSARLACHPPHIDVLIRG